MTLETLLKTLQLSLHRPRDGMRVVLGWQLSLSESVTVLSLMAVLSAALISLVIGPLPPEIDPVSAVMLSNPVYLAAVQLAGLAMISTFLDLLGRVAKGNGTLSQAFALMAWLEALMIVVSVAQSVVLLLFPALGLILVPAGMVYSLWLMTNFVAEMHGFRSRFLTLLGVIAAFTGSIIAMILVFFLLFALGILHV